MNLALLQGLSGSWLAVFSTELFLCDSVLSVKLSREGRPFSMKYF